SLTIGDSVAAESARAARVPTVERHIFLDNDPRPEAIAAQLEQAAVRSLEHPTIAIAHPSLAVARSLRNALPELHARGIGIFSMREFMERETRWRAPANRGKRAASKDLLDP
ncbi:MAG: divergent polysaccharide deacetylase family protein, partial [Nannocystaceae bacterium]